MQLPVSLTRYFADSKLNVDSFSRKACVLEIRIEKEIGPEVGMIRFHGVFFMSVSTAFPGEAIRILTTSEMPISFWKFCPLDQRDLEPDDVVFEIEDQDAHLHHVIAKTVEYEILQH